MGQHDFLDRSSFSVIRIISEDLKTGKKKVGSGFIVHAFEERYYKEAPMFLISNRNTFSESERVVSLEFHEQQPHTRKDDPQKKFVVEIRSTSSKITEHPDSRIDLACLDISSFVTAKFIKGVNPFFYFNGYLEKISPIPSYLRGNFRFTSCHVFPHSEERSPVPFIQNYEIESKSDKRTMYYDAGSPTITASNEKVKFDGCPIEKTLLKTTIATTGFEVRELVRCAKKRAANIIPQHAIARNSSVSTFV